MENFSGHQAVLSKEIIQRQGVDTRNFITSGQKTSAFSLGGFHVSLWYDKNLAAMEPGEVLHRVHKARSGHITTSAWPDRFQDGQVVVHLPEGKMGELQVIHRGEDGVRAQKAVKILGLVTFLALTGEDFSGLCKVRGQQGSILKSFTCQNRLSQIQAQTKETCGGLVIGALMAYIGMDDIIRAVDFFLL